MDISRAVAALPLPQREVVALRLGEGLTFREIAAVLSVKKNTVQSRYRMALKKLRAALTEEPAGGDDDG